MLKKNSLWYKTPVRSDRTLAGHHVLGLSQRPWGQQEDRLKEILLENTQEDHLRLSICPPRCSQVAIREPTLSSQPRKKYFSYAIITKRCNQDDQTLMFVYAALTEHESKGCEVTISSVMSRSYKKQPRSEVGTFLLQHKSLYVSATLSRKVTSSSTYHVQLSH